MDPRSAPMLNPFATATSVTAPNSTQRGNRSLMRAASPCPVTRPSRPAVSWTAAASGSVIQAVHSNPKPKAAPACEYVPMPDGSSSEAPVTNPGPSRRKYPNPRSVWRCGWWPVRVATDRMVRRDLGACAVSPCYPAHRCPTRCRCGRGASGPRICSFRTGPGTLRTGSCSSRTRVARTRLTRVTDEPIGVILAAATGGGDQVVWLRDTTGDESGEWMAVPFEGGEPRPLLAGAAPGWPDGIAMGRTLVAAVLADREGFGLFVSEDGGSAKEILRRPDRMSISSLGDLELEGSTTSGLSADEDLLCLLVSQSGDDIHHGLLVMDPRTGEVVGEQADGPGLALSAGAWSPVPGDRRLAIAHERRDVHRPAIWDLATGERTDVELDLPGEAFPVDWWPDGRALLLLHVHDGRDQALRFDLASGQITEI